MPITKANAGFGESACRNIFAECTGSIEQGKRAKPGFPEFIAIARIVMDRPGSVSY